MSTLGGARAQTPWAPHMTCACPLPDAHDCLRSRCGERAFDDGLGEIECDACGCECECACHEPGDDDDCE